MVKVFALLRLRIFPFNRIWRWTMKIIEGSTKEQGAKDGIMPLPCVSTDLSWQESVAVYAAAVCME
jgi:hypothetical protein